ncbi:MAG: gliding motility-associated ABC transporter permease subunit GldF [Bacteroidales bacterium]|nr:gliding motility-associated ABC transporter permease subunit GldF [Bacteroidales bacterium]
MLVLFRKELSAFLSSLIGYVVIVVFLLINGLFLWVLPAASNIPAYGYANLDGLFSISPFVFLFLIPAITMRFFADENKSGTIEILMTKPITDLEIILAKYFAGLVLVVVSLLPTLVYFYSVYKLGLPQGNIDSGATWGSYIGLLFLGASFVAAGVFSSSVTDNQIVSFILAAFVCAFLYAGFEFIYSFEWFGGADLIVKNLGMSTHYASLSRGVIDTRDVLYFISLMVFFLLLTKISLESRKW